MAAKQQHTNVGQTKRQRSKPQSRKIHVSESLFRGTQVFRTQHFIKNFNLGPLAFCSFSYERHRIMFECSINESLDIFGWRVSQRHHLFESAITDPINSGYTFY